MQSWSLTKSVTKYVSLFSQRTSIRGIPKILNTKESTIKWFWSSFIVIAHIVMMTIVSLLIMRYFRFDTTMKISSMKATSLDFPEITICSKRFFDMESSEKTSPFEYLSNYSKNIYIKSSNLFNEDKFDEAIRIIKHQYTSSSFFHTYYNYLQQRSYELAIKLQKSCNVLIMTGPYNKNEKKPCRVKAIFNPLYLNCLAFSVSHLLY